MKKPYKYHIFCKISHRFINETNDYPTLNSLSTWESTDDEHTKRLVESKVVYVDCRYEAKLRLYNYITYTKNGLATPNYKPYDNKTVHPIYPNNK